MEQEYKLRMEQDREIIEKYLAQTLEEMPQYGDLQQAMKYSLLAGGKRLRPVLVLECCRMCGGAVEKALPFACGLEMIHTYSLIHDDLPAMDDDDLRRGRPTNHKVYGEATAILAGDALQMEAFTLLASAQLPAEQIVQATACLAKAAGQAGMVGGQVLDMAGEGRALNREELELLQSLKTGALIEAAAELGCIAAGGSQQQRECLRRYAAALGRAFQIRDDVLDVTSTQDELGKPIGSDNENEKSTFVTALGVERCALLVEELTRDAIAALDGFEQPDFLIWLAEKMAQRTM